MPLSQDNHLAVSLGILNRFISRGLLLLDTHAHLEFANSSACDLLGYLTQEDLKRHWETIKPLLRLDSNLPETLKPRLFKIDLPVHGERRCLRAEIHARDDLHSGYLLLIKDREKMDALETNLLLASQMHSQIYLQAALSHDLRAPLNTMQITLELLGETLADPTLDPDKSSQQRCIAVMKEELARLSRGLRTVLDRNVLLNPARQEFDLRDLVKEIATLLETHARRHHLNLKCRLPDDPIKTMGQREWLKQALLNVAINGLEATPADGCLEIDVKIEHSTVSIAIQDQGPSLSEEQRDEIYSASFAAEKNSKGVGLYVARMLVELHGGTFQATALADKGNCFTLNLPLAQPDTAGKLSNKQDVLVSEKI